MIDGAGRDRGRRSIDDRAVSINVGYTTNLVVMTIIFVGLLTAGTGVVDSERTAVAQTELDVAGNQLAAALMSTDRAAQVAAADANESGVATDGVEVRRTIELPERTVGETYTVAIDEDRIELEIDDRDVWVVVQYDTAIDVEGAEDGELELTGGAIVISYDHEAEHLEVDNV